MREAGADFAFVRMFKARAKNLRLRVAHLFTFNDDENYPSALLTWSASVLHSNVDRLCVYDFIQGHYLVIESPKWLCGSGVTPNTG